MVCVIPLAIAMRGTAPEPPASPPVTAVVAVDPPASTTQLPTRMHEPVQEPLRIRVGHADDRRSAAADLVGRDNRVIQAAIDFAARFETGSAPPVVEVGPGRFAMHDSLHLRSGVVVKGTTGQTILTPRPAVTSVLARDGDYGEEQITLADPTGFAVGQGVLIEADDVKYFHATVARIIGRSGATFMLDQPLRSDCMVRRNARATTVFPVISGCGSEAAHVAGFVIEGNGRDGLPIEGCRGAGIYLLRAHGTTIATCEIRHFPGDGVSYQQSNDVTVRECVAVGNAGHGFHPGSGSQRTVMTGCRAEDNGLDGMFICWRVKEGTFADNLFVGNARNGVSIGHKDTDNLLRNNTIRANAAEGILFRDELPAMAADRNRLLDNTIEDNGTAAAPVAGIRIRGATSGNELRGNLIRDTRAEGARRQTIGVIIEAPAGDNRLDGNLIEAAEPIRDERATSAPPSP